MSRCEFCRDDSAMAYAVAPVRAERFVLCRLCAAALTDSLSSDEGLVPLFTAEVAA